ncbi:MAG TPA: hypothetical protein VLD18_05860, partial [Verrucomicrobiae bacterium]|nr:hypothetical protein [Verrucomicrobiae bacterium]
RVNVSRNALTQDSQSLRELLEERLGTERATEVLQPVLLSGANIQSVLEFYRISGMTADEFALVHTDLTASNNPPEGLVNVNTASEAVMACLPGIGLDNAPALVAFRQANPGRLDSMAWVTEILEPDAIAQCGRFLTDQAYQFTADVAAVGPNGRGIHRTRFVFDNSDDTPRIIFRRDLTSLGWALSPWVREEIQLAMENQR